MIDVEPGIYPGIARAEYDQIRGINWSVLSRFKKSAAHARLEQTAPPDPNSEQEFGSLFHTLVLEPDLIPERYVLVPEDAPTKRSNAGKAWWVAFEEDNRGKERVTQDELDKARVMRDSLYANERASELLTYPGAFREVTVVWDDPATGTRCKGRIDILSRLQGMTVVADLKTHRDPAPWWFSKSLDDYNWAGQLCWYLNGLNAAVPTKAERVPYYLVVENQPPHCAVTYELGQASREAAEQAARAYMTRFIESERAGRWPGYADGVIELPAYALNRVQ